MSMKQYFKGFDFEGLNNEIDYLNSLVSGNSEENNVFDFAYQLTAYEQGYIDYEKGLIESLYLSMDIDKYNDYLIENRYEEFKPFDEYTINEYFVTPYEALRACQFGSVSFNDDWFKLDGYANIETYSNSEIESEMEQNNNFKKWLVEQDYAEFLEDDVREDILKLTRHLINQGF